MNHTVVGLFDDNTQTQRAVERLKAMGISTGKIDVARRRDQDAGVKTEPGEPKEWIGTSNINDNNLTRFFKSLFSDRDDDMSERYSRAASSGHAVVTVHTASHEEAVSVADILDECGAINVDEHTTNSHQSTYRSTTATPPVQNNSNEQDRMFGEQSRVTSENTSSESNRMRMRSQIINRSLEDDIRLRNSE
ncbi:MAG TPA: hypothetical protein VD794_04420, partial [Flavisolibacter sp.]|nr:hypothetical protein [Flavisolibacter sp.]